MIEDPLEKFEIELTDEAIDAIIKPEYLWGQITFILAETRCGTFNVLIKPAGSHPDVADYYDVDFKAVWGGGYVRITKDKVFFEETSGSFGGIPNIVGRRICESVQERIGDSKEVVNILYNGDDNNGDKWGIDFVYY
ncbi:hypothetical protein ACFLZH_04085 [Patescibacteria group bacterium]